MFKLLINSKRVNQLMNSPLRIIKYEQKSQIIQSSTTNQVIQSNLLFVSQTVGQIYLYKQYINSHKALMSYQVSNSGYSSDFQIKTQILFINKVDKGIYLRILQHAQQRQEHIQLIQLIQEKTFNDKMKMSIIIYFKNTLISQEFYTFVVYELKSFALYIKQVTVMSKPIHQELEKQFAFIINQFQKKELQKESDNSLIYKQEYIQIPRCLICLIKLQCQVSGLSQSLLHNNILISHQIPCQNCLIISNNHKSQIICKICSTNEDIWICMVCGDFGCGRYKNKDAFKHFVATGHIITMDLATQRIWNYISDCFSHRIVSLQKQEVSIKFPDYSTKKNDSLYEQSLQAAFWEYCSLVSQQLKRQRAFYSRQRAEQEDKFERNSVQTQKYFLAVQKQIDKSNTEVKKLAKKNKKLEKRLAQLKQKCKDDRQILDGYNRYLKQDHKIYTIEQIDHSNPRIRQKLKILQGLQKQIEGTLLKLQQ